MELIKILVVDRRAIVNTGISLILERVPDFQVMGQAKNSEEVFQLLDHDPPDVVCMDIDLPGPVGGLELIRRLHDSYPFTRVVVLTNLLEPTVIREALKAGVMGYLIKDATANELANAIRAASMGTPTLCSEVVKVLVKKVFGSQFPLSHPARTPGSRPGGAGLE